MKKYRMLVPVGMVGIMLASWYCLVADSVKAETTYNSYLNEARKQAENGVTKYAIENYNMALEIESSPELYAEVAEFYKSQERYSEYLAWSKNFFEIYPGEVEAYYCILDAYLLNMDYEACFDVLKTAEKRRISSDYIKQVAEDLEYVYKIDFNTFEDAAVYSNNYSPVKNKDVWGFVDRYGKQRVACKYLEVGAYTQSGFVSVVNSDGECYFIDKAGEKVLISKDKYQSFGLLVDDKIAAERTDGKYTYVDSEFNVLFGEYDYASTLNNGIAAVKIGDVWQLIDSDGKNITTEKYVDIKLDEKQIAYRNDRIFVALSDGNYMMVNGSGKQVGSLTFEDAKVFASDAPAAVKINGKWCFVDSDGKLISEKKYDDARSFVNDLAAVCVAGKWGFVDVDENIVIDTTFFGAKDFNEKGSCFVKTGDMWQLLKLYRLNRED